MDISKVGIEKFDGSDFGFWKMQIGDYLYQTNLYEPLLGVKPESMAKDMKEEGIEQSSSDDECFGGGATAYGLLLNALSLIPIAHYIFALCLAALVFIYNFLEFHILEDLRSGFRGCLVKVTCDRSSDIYVGVVSKCRILHERYLTTPWLSSPHIQTAFVNFLGSPPAFLKYEREIFEASDGGCIALDWLRTSHRLSYQSGCDDPKEDPSPITVVIPGLMSDSSSAYIQHLAFDIAKNGWNVVISNHRGLGGVEITSDCFYNAGWTSDIRAVICYISQQYPRAPIFVVGTSIGANVLVKYLGEEGENVPIAGAAAIGCPWDLLVGDRFLSRRLVQKLYGRAISLGMRRYAVLHQTRLSRLANWSDIERVRCIRDFDNHATRVLGQFETVDTYYRRCSSANYIGNVSVPLLCISALDDPVCTKESIPWDECRLNKNVVLATVNHGGHLGFFEGFTGASLWWVRATNEFLRVLHSSPYMHVQKLQMQNPGQVSALESKSSSVDEGPYVNVDAEGMVAPASSSDMTIINASSSTSMRDVVVRGNGIKRYVSNLMSRSRGGGSSIRLLAYVALLLAWPTVGSALQFLFARRKQAALRGPQPPKINK